MSTDEAVVVETMLLLDVVGFPLEVVVVVESGVVVVVMFGSHPYFRFMRRMSFSVKEYPPRGAV